MRLLLMLGLAGTAVTFLGSLALWFYNDERRIRRALRRVLKAEPEAVIAAQGRGRGAGFSFVTGMLAVAWDKGGWCLVYRLDELTGAELHIDGQVAARVYRGEPRRALDQAGASAGQVTLRLIFDDPRHPDFELDLWVRGDENRRDDWSPRAAIQQANQWLARVEAILRRPARPRPLEPEAAIAPAQVSTPPQPRFQARPAPPPLPRAAPDDPPWDEDDEDVFEPEPARPSAPAPAPPPHKRAVRRDTPPWEDEPEFDFGADEDEDDDR